MPERLSRRDQICQAAIALAARGGSHALTHQAIDAELGIAKGSTSYYYRTRAALIAGVAEFLAAQSRAVFHDLLARHAGEDPDTVIDTYLAHLAASRRDHVRARLALALDADCGVEQRTGLAECLFSLEGAVALLRSRAHPQPEVGASDLLDRLEGHILRKLILADPA
ncbi:TetR family transcriptional regulator [Rhodococcus sp. IEGM 1408]|uniref:TetR/AcrR family transcriptional regulator n=1 Tax=Rhodococcus sp. IEGM 1408 TaxID=3082220 RepID=UPI002953A81D|nr:TetR family transcriptional regulator [Rhodococcus sp. IEGM 1408]MDV7999989.1 TetR family transcriptional regulator [Rhodococcus sp. IEGM 1408]